jgi:hypothetical protein
LRYPFARVDRAQAENDTDGFVKALAVGARGRIVGAQIVGPAAGELIHEWTLAIRMRANASQVSSLVHVFPTLSMGNQRAADRFFESSPMSRWAAGLSRRYFRWRRRGEPSWRSIAANSRREPS